MSSPMVEQFKHSEPEISLKVCYPLAISFLSYRHPTTLYLHLFSYYRVRGVSNRPVGEEGKKHRLKEGDLSAVPHQRVSAASPAAL